MKNIHIIDEISEGSYPITITLYESGSSKLQLVKAIKEITKYGLKESKDIVDSIPYCPQILKTWKNINQISDIKYMLSNCVDCKYEITDVQSIRNSKLIELGICDKNDIISELVNRDIEKIISEKFNYTAITELLYNRYSEISEDKLKSILNIK